MNKEKQVLALKYRPQNFEDLIGQDVVAETISKAIKQLKETHGLNLKEFHQCRAEDRKIVKNIRFFKSVAWLKSPGFKFSLDINF